MGDHVLLGAIAFYDGRSLFIMGDRFLSWAIAFCYGRSLFAGCDRFSLAMN
jgi:hypothetical protein